jgi:nucleoside phosphorylase
MGYKPLSSVDTKTARNGLRSAVIITALPIEIQAILAHLIDRHTVFGKKNMLYECGVFPDPSGRWFIAAVEIGAGNQGAASAVHAALADFDDIDIVLFSGIAGSLKDEVTFGHVVASSQMCDFHSGKSADEFKARPRSQVRRRPAQLRLHNIRRQ